MIHRVITFYKDHFSWIYVGIYVIIALCLLPLYQYQINADAVSYIDIARKYAVGDLGNALNAYWGPLFSWLIVPFLWIGFKGMLAAKLALIVCGALAIAGTGSLLQRFSLLSWVRQVTLGVTTLFILSATYKVTSPDLLILALSLWYFSALFTWSDIPQQRRRWLVLGLIGGLLYLAKSYGLVFFFASFLASVGVFSTGKSKVEKKALLQSAKYVLLVCASVVVVWAALLSNKYGTLTISTSAKYNQVFASPNFSDNPIRLRGLMPPPNEAATSGWEDPSLVPIDAWSPLHSVDDMKHQVRVILRNTVSMLTIYQQFSPFFLAVIFFIIAVAFSRKWRDSLQEIQTLLIGLVIAVGGYLLLFIEERYIWLGMILFLIFAAYFLSQLGRGTKLSKIGRVILAGAFFMIPVTTAVYDLQTNINIRKEYYDLAKTLRQEGVILKDARIASKGEWGQTLYLAFYSEGSYYGVPRPNAESEEVLADLKRHGIDYFFIYGEYEQYLEKELGLTEVTKSKLPGLRIYKLATP